jgi:hypothetical protein
MYSGVPMPLPLKHSKVEAIMEDRIDGCFGHAYAKVIEICLGNGLHAVISRRAQVKDSSDNPRFDWVDLIRAVRAVVPIAERNTTGVNSGRKLG